jgi:hypothetical protein
MSIRTDISFLSRKVRVGFSWNAIVGRQVPGPFSLEVSIDDHWSVLLDAHRLVFTDFEGACIRTSIAGELRSRDVPDVIATAMSKAIARDVANWQTGDLVIIALGSFEDRAAGW